MTEDSPEPIGGDTNVIGVTEQDYYNKDDGDFGTRKLAKVEMGDGVSPNDVGMVVDLLNEYEAEDIRNAVMDK